MNKTNINALVQTIERSLDSIYKNQESILRLSYCAIDFLLVLMIVQRCNCSCVDAIEY